MRREPARRHRRHGVVDGVKKKRGIVAKEGEEDLEKGNLFATGLVAGGALMGVVFAFLNIPDKLSAGLKKLSVEHGLINVLGLGWYYIVGVAFFALMGWMLYRTAMRKSEIEI